MVAHSLHELAEVSRHAVPLVLMLSAALVGSACQSDPPITVEDGQVEQVSAFVTYRDHPPRDVILVVNATADDAPFREEVRTALSSAMNDLHVPGGRWDAVDVHAWVVDVATHAIVGPNDDPRLAWREQDATSANADALVAAVMDRWPRANGAADADATLETMGLALAQIPIRPRSNRVGVMITKDAGLVAKSAGLAYDSYDSETEGSTRIGMFLPGGTRERGCTPEDWATGVAYDPQAPTCALPFDVTGPSDVAVAACTPWLYWRDGAGEPVCRVRAVVADDSQCAPRRGWTPSIFPPTTVEDDAGHRTAFCDVLLLTGEDGRRCRDLEDSCEGCGSGYCVPDQAKCRGLRFIGGAASDTSLEIVCNRL